MTLALAIFGRAPVAGRTKTRLIPALGAEGAASLYAAFLRDVLDHAADVPNVARHFWSADDARCETLNGLLDGMPRSVQPGGDLGTRMLRALAKGLERHDASAVIGSDAPTLPAAYVSTVEVALEHADVVLGPSADGGYYLIAARRVHAEMFRNVRFSSAHALNDTERACGAAGLRCARLPVWYDVDTPRDLALLRAHLKLAPDAAPASAEWLGVEAP